MLTTIAYLLMTVTFLGGILALCALVAWLLALITRSPDAARKRLRLAGLSTGGAGLGFVAFFLLAVVSPQSLPKPSPAQPDAPQAVAASNAGSSPAPAPEAVEVVIPDYLVSQTYPIGSSGKGFRLVIPRKHANTKDMAAIVRHIEAEHGATRNMVVNFFLSERAAAFQRGVGTASPADRKHYGNNWIGQATMNEANGYHELSVFPDGQGGAAHQTVKL